MVLVTGATGLVGSRICFDLLKRGQRVRAMKRQGSEMSVIHYTFKNDSKLFSSISKYADGGAIYYNNTHHVFLSPYLPQSFNEECNVRLSFVRSVFVVPRVFTSKSLATGVMSCILVANHVECSLGIAIPSIIPGKPSNDSGPPLTGISSV